MFVFTPSVVAALALAEVGFAQSTPSSSAASTPSASITPSGVSSSSVTSAAPSSSITSSTLPSSSITSAVPSPSATSPFVPAGGFGTNATPPVYAPMSDFDFQSINLALNQEWLELDLFHHGLAQFTAGDFAAAGLGSDDLFLIEFMADQQVGHTTLLSNILGPSAAQPCNYTYTFTTVREFVDFCQKITRLGESSVYGFLEHLDSRAAASLLLQSVAIDARQQMIFRQFEGLFPMPVWFEPAITQSMAWTLLSPFITSCPAVNPRIVFQNFPPLLITNNPSALDIFNTTLEGNSTLPAITNNRTNPLSAPGQAVNFVWSEPGSTTGYNNSYTTNTTAGDAKFVAWISQLNTTYTPLFDINGTSGSTLQPNGSVFGNNSIGLVNGTMFVAVTDLDVFVTPFNLSEMNSHIVAGPAIYQAG